MQMEYFSGFFAIAINRIAKDGPTHGLTMHTQLMCATGLGFELKPGRALASPHDAPSSLSRQAFRIGFHPPAFRAVHLAERHIDEAVILLRSAADNGPIGFLHFAITEKSRKIIKRLAMTPKNETAGRILIKPVRQHRWLWQAETQMREELLHVIAAALGIGMRLMHRNAGGLVDDKHHRIAIKNAALYVFWRHGRSVTLPFVAGKHYREAMSDETPKKPGLMARLFGAGTPPQAPDPSIDVPKLSWWQKLKTGLSRSSSSIGQGITDLFTKRKLDAATLEEFEDVLIRADLGIKVATRIIDAVGKGRYGKEISGEDVKAILAEEVTKALAPVAKPLLIDDSKKPFVLLMVGVNGAGKTTTIGKLASKFKAEGRHVMLAAGDTFRAAAIEQLQAWGQRVGAPVITRPQGSDASGLVFDALEEATTSHADILMIDTAGRLQNRSELMAELEKVIRVIKKKDASAPHAVLLVLDATVGQNALSQVEIFGKIAGVTGLVMTKLDGTARGGILVALAEKFALPIHFIGVGEAVDDLEPFQADEFGRAIAGLDEAPQSSPAPTA